MKSRQETGPKVRRKKGEDKMSDSNRQNNNRADRKMESNDTDTDSPEIPDNGEDISRTRSPFGLAV